MFNWKGGVKLSSPDAGQNREEGLVNKLFEYMGKIDMLKGQRHM